MPIDGLDAMKHASSMSSPSSPSNGRPSKKTFGDLDRARLAGEDNASQMRPKAALLSFGERRIEALALEGEMNKVQLGVPSGPEVGDENTS